MVLTQVEELNMFTKETIIKTRQWFADNSLACIDEVKSGKVRVNNPDSYFAERLQNAKDSLDGKHDHTLAFKQRAHFIQTGECPALLP